jgi:plasmid stabilization system protein ParE
MAKKIVWTETAVRDRFRIYQFWHWHNKSENYSLKLEKLFNESAKIISRFPEVGTKTDFKDVRLKVVRNYKIFYCTLEDRIEIIRVWDAKQDSDSLQL